MSRVIVEGRRGDDEKEEWKDGWERRGKEEKTKKGKTVEAVRSRSYHIACEVSVCRAPEGSVSHVLNEVCKGFTFKGAQRAGLPLEAAVGSGFRGSESFWKTKEVWIFSMEQRASLL